MDYLSPGKKEMMPEQHLRKEKEILQGYILKCKNYLSFITQKKQQIELLYITGKTSKEDYELELSTLYSSETLYQDLLPVYEKKLQDVQRKLFGRRASLAALLLLLAMPGIIFVLKSPDLTGQVVFSNVESYRDAIEKTFTENSTLSFKPLLSGGLHTFSVSGSYTGDGSVRLYLEFHNLSYLVYGTETSASFESVCGQACILPDIGEENYTLRVIMPKGATLVLSHADYFISELQQFELSPENITINLTETRFIKYKFSIYNPRHLNFSVILYPEGDFTNYTTLYSWKEYFSDNDSSREIRYDIDVPWNTPAGMYEQRIAVQYLPEGKFSGTPPKQVHTVLVHIDNKEEKLSPQKNYLRLSLLILLVVLVTNFLFFVFRKRYRRREIEVKTEKGV